MAESDRGASSRHVAGISWRARPSRRSAFVRELAFDALPADVVEQARALPPRPRRRRRGGRPRPRRRDRGCQPSRSWAAVRPRRALLLDGRRAGLAGAAFAGAATIDAFDAHDGHVLTKGHAGVAVLPALLAVDAKGEPGAESTAASS